jgi:hypothetical protein
MHRVHHHPHQHDRRTKVRGRVVSTPYSGGPWFKYRPAVRLSRLNFFMDFLSPPSRCCDSTFKLGHRRFVPHPFQLIIHVTLSFEAIYSESLKRRP